MSQSDIINTRQIQWFPGHMTKTLRLMEKEIRNVDCVLQILDARIPLSSLNPEIERITAGKPHLYIQNNGWPISEVPAPGAWPWIPNKKDGRRQQKLPSNGNCPL